jgi:hypothetical protein
MKDCSILPFENVDPVGSSAGFGGVANTLHIAAVGGRYTRRLDIIIAIYDLVSDYVFL